MGPPPDAVARGLRFGLLGPMEVHGPRGPVAVSAGRQRTILALLLLNAGEVVSRDRLVDELWGEQPPPNAVKALQVHIAHLRRALAAAIGNEPARRLLATRPPGYVLQVDPGALDLHRLEAAVAEARRALEGGNAVAARRLVVEAMRLWRGPPLADLDVERSLHAEVPRIEELRASAQELAVEAALRLGRHDEALPEVEALVSEHPLRERPRGQLMLCLYRCGRQADALEAYQTARKAVVDELGIEPGPRLRELHQAILRQDPALALPAPAAAESPVEPGTPFVGRRVELAELVAALEDACAGRGRLVLVGGDPGIGKSRLAERLLARAQARGARTLVGRCWEAGGAPAYWPWVQSMRAYVRDADTEALRHELAGGAAELAQILPELRERLPDLPEPSVDESPAARFRLFDAMSHFLRRASAARTVVLLLDDLHAADTPSLLLLRFVARELGSSHIMVLGCYRDTPADAGPTLTELLAEAAREPVTRRLPLRGLTRGELTEYLEATASELSSPELAMRLAEQTEGNPLFLTEMVRLLAMERPSPDVARGRVPIPETVRDVIARRLAHLSAECHRMLTLASVIGREFSLGALSGLTGAGEDGLLGLLDEAMAAGVVSDVPDASRRLRFSHVLVRDTLYEGLTTARRSLLHRRVVDALEALTGDDPGPNLAELAHHAIAGGAIEKGVRHARRAGDRALSLLAYEEAARWYLTALDAAPLLPAADEPGRCRLLLSLGEAHARAGSTADAKTAFLEAADVARQQAWPRELALAAVGYGGRIVWGRAGDDGRLVPLLEEALAALGDEEVELRARLLARLAGALRDEPARDRRDALSREAVDLARRSGTLPALAYALDGRAAAIVAPDTVAELLALGDELCAVGERLGDREPIVAGHCYRSIARLQMGDVEGSHAEISAASRLSGELRQPAQAWEVLSAEAMLAVATGRLLEGEELVRRTRAVGERVHVDAVLPNYWLERYVLCDFRGDDLKELLAPMTELAERYPARPMLRCALAHLEARLGRDEAATRGLLALAADAFATVPFDQEWLFAMSLLAETAAQLGESRSGRILYDLLLPWADHNAADQGEGIRGSVSRYLGLLAHAMRRWDAADAHFRIAVAENARMGLRPWTAHARYDHARMLQHRDAPGDRARALDLLEQALGTYRELGMPGYAAKVSRLVGGAS